MRQPTSSMVTPLRAGPMAMVSSWSPWCGKSKTASLSACRRSSSEIPCSARWRGSRAIHRRTYHAFATDCGQHGALRWGTGFSVAAVEDDSLILRVHLSLESVAGRPGGDEEAPYAFYAYSVPLRHVLADFTYSAYRGGVEAWAIHPVRAAARCSGALTLLPLPDQLLNRARQSRLEVD
jgi:hypothetical protein